MIAEFIAYQADWIQNSVQICKTASYINHRNIFILASPATRYPFKFRPREGIPSSFCRRMTRKLCVGKATLISQSLLFRAQLSIASISWCYKSGRCAKSYARRSVCGYVIRAVEVLVLFCFSSSCSEGSGVGGLQVLWEFLWWFSCKIMGILWM
jgi:hypothetical protein